MLTNLKMIYLSQRELPKALAAVERIVVLFPEAVVEVRDAEAAARLRGLLYYQLGRLNEAEPDLQAYVAKVPEADDAPVIRQLLRQIGKQF